MKRLPLLLFIIICTVPFSPGLCQENLHTSPSLTAGIEGIVFGKGKLDVELITEIISQKQEELKNAAIRNVILTQIEDGSFAFLEYAVNSINLILNEKNKKVMTKELLEYTANLALVYGFAEYYVRRMWHSKRLNIDFLDLIEKSVVGEQISMKSKRMWLNHLKSKPLKELQSVLNSLPKNSVNEENVEPILRTINSLIMKDLSKFKEAPSKKKWRVLYDEIKTIKEKNTINKDTIDSILEEIFPKKIRDTLNSTISEWNVERPTSFLATLKPTIEKEYYTGTELKIKKNKELKLNGDQVIFQKPGKRITEIDLGHQQNDQNALSHLVIDMIYDICKRDSLILKRGFFKMPAFSGEEAYRARSHFWRRKILAKEKSELKNQIDFIRSELLKIDYKGPKDLAKKLKCHESLLFQPIINFNYKNIKENDLKRIQEPLNKIRDKLNQIDRNRYDVLPMSISKKWRYSRKNPNYGPVTIIEFAKDLEKRIKTHHEYGKFSKTLGPLYSSMKNYLNLLFQHYKLIDKANFFRENEIIDYLAFYNQKSNIISFFDEIIKKTNFETSILWKEILNIKSNIDTFKSFKNNLESNFKNLEKRIDTLNTFIHNIEAPPANRGDCANTTITRLKERANAAQFFLIDNEIQRIVEEAEIIIDTLIEKKINTLLLKQFKSDFTPKGNLKITDSDSWDNYVNRITKITQEILKEFNTYIADVREEWQKLDKQDKFQNLIKLKTNCQQFLYSKAIDNDLQHKKYWDKLIETWELSIEVVKSIDNTLQDFQKNLALNRFLPNSEKQINEKIIKMKRSLGNFGFDTAFFQEKISSIKKLLFKVQGCYNNNRSKELIKSFYDSALSMEGPGNYVGKFQDIKKFFRDSLAQLVPTDDSCQYIDSLMDESESLIAYFDLQDVSSFKNFINEKFEEGQIRNIKQLLSSSQDFVQLVSRLQNLDQVDTYEYVFRLLTDIGTIFANKSSSFAFNNIVNNIRKYSMIQHEENSIIIDVESIILDLATKFEGRNQIGNLLEFKSLFTVGMNYAFPVTSKNSNKPKKNYFGNQDINALTFASEKIGLQLVILNFDARRRLPNNDSYLSSSGAKRSFKNSGVYGKHPIISNWYFQLFGSGLLYQISALNSADSLFSQPTIGYGTGISFFNGLSVSANLQHMLLKDTPILFSIGMDIRFLEYFKALGEKRRRTQFEKQKLKSEPLSGQAQY